MKILVVEDDQWFGKSIAKTLQQKNHVVQIVSSANSAIIAVDDFVPDLILLDVLLGNQNGLTLLNEMQSYLDTRKINVVILTTLENLQLDDLRNFNVKAILNKATITPEKIIKICEEAVNG